MTKFDNIEIIQKDVPGEKTKKGFYAEIGQKMKQYENIALKSTHLNPLKPVIVRLDGNTFHTFANCFIKPFDHLLHEIMVQTTSDLIQKYPCVTVGYTQSDEISLVIPEMKVLEKDEQGNVTKHGDLPYGGRILKLATVMAGYCSTRFNYHCVKMAQEDKWKFLKEVQQSGESRQYEKIMKKLTGGSACFDARLLNVDSRDEVLECILWRSNYDCVRNSRNNLGRKYFSQKEMHRLSTRDVVEKLEKEKNVLWKDQPTSFKYGTFVKREKTQFSAVNQKTNEEVNAQRTIMKSMSFGVPRVDSKYTPILFEKYWNNVDEKIQSEMLE